MRNPLNIAALLLVIATGSVESQPSTDLDSGLKRLVADYTRLYTRDSLARWRQLFLPSFTSTSISADSSASSRGLEQFVASQERGFTTATRMGERLENVRVERRGRMATVWADFVYWHDDDGRRGRLILTAAHGRDGWRFASLIFSYYD
jgi:hypothetical protein